MSSPTWGDVVTLTARHAEHLPEPVALLLLDQHPGAADALAGRSDLTDAVAVALVAHARTLDGWARGQLLGRVAGNPALSGAQQVALAELAQEPNTLDAFERSRIVTALAKHGTDPQMVAVLVRAATTGSMTKSPWQTLGQSEVPADHSALEHALMTMANRPELDEALVAADFLRRVYRRAHLEIQVRGLKDSSLLVGAAHTHGLRHQAEYTQVVVADPHPLTLQLFAHRVDQPAPIRDLITDRIVLALAATNHGCPLEDVSDLIYWAWKNMTSAQQDQVRDAVADADLSGEGRRDWLRALLRARTTPEQLLARGWATMPLDQVRPALDEQDWQVPAEVANALWARPDVDSALAIELLRTSNTINFKHAPSLRPHDRAFAVALYTSVPGYLRDVTDLDLVAATLPSLLKARPDCADTMVKDGHLARIGDRVHHLPWTTQVQLAAHDPALAASLAQRIQHVLIDPAAGTLLRQLFAADADTTPASFGDLVSALASAKDTRAA